MGLRSNIMYDFRMLSLHKFSMGATAAIITSMGLIAGLTQGIDAKEGIISGLFIIAIADNISDSFSIHIYSESEGASPKDVRISTLGNFAVRFLLVLTFALIVLVSAPRTALIVSSVWGLLLLVLLSYSIAQHRKLNPVRHSLWHVFVALLVIAGSRLLGNLILHVMTHA